MTDPSAALYGRAWVNHPEPKRKGRKVDGPVITGSRQQAVADALKMEDRERIKAEAKEAAARIMAEWEFKRGRK